MDDQPETNQSPADLNCRVQIEEASTAEVVETLCTATLGPGWKIRRGRVLRLSTKHKDLGGYTRLAIIDWERKGRVCIESDFTEDQWEILILAFTRNKRLINASDRTDDLWVADLRVLMTEV